MRGITPPGRTRSSRIAFRARLRPSLRPISCPRTSSRASMRCPCVFAGSRDERDLIESSTEARSSTFRACIRSTENDSRSRERPSSETCTCPSDHRSTARVSTFRGHRLELFADTRARPRGEGEGELTSLLVGALRAGAAGGRRDATIAYPPKRGLHACSGARAGVALRPRPPPVRGAPLPSARRRPSIVVAERTPT